MSLPLFLRRLGYRCEARVSLPVLNPATLLAAHFDYYELLPVHNNLASALDALTFSDQPVFHFINAGETHYPYTLAHETTEDLPKLAGVHGTWCSLDEFLARSACSPIRTPSNLQFNARALRPLWEKQVHCVEHLDGVIGRAVRRMPKDTWLIVTSDHGELFGEDGWFGHGPVRHEKVFEVFLVEGLNPSSSTAP
jgi:arylsulfatase A-like enzyme